MKYVGENSLPKLLNLLKSKLDIKLNKNGDTLTGPLTLYGNPTENLHASTKQYVDDAISAATSGHDMITVLVSSDWTANGTDGYYKSVSVPGIHEDDIPIADVSLGDNAATNAQYLEAWRLVTRITTGENSITLYANGAAPTTAFTIRLKVVQ